MRKSISPELKPRRMRPGTRLKHYLSYLGVRAAMKVMGVLPARYTLRAFEIGGKLAWPFAGRRRKLGDDNLKRCLPELSESQRKEILKESLVSLSLIIPEILCHRQLGKEPDRWSEIEGFDYLEQALKSGRGFFIGTCHFGTWAMVWIASRISEPTPLALIIKRQENPYLDRLINRFVPNFRAVRLADRGTGKAVVEAIEAGSVIGFFLDQAALPHQGRVVDFFGQPALTHIVPFHLALKHNIPFFPVFLVRTAPGRCRTIIRPALPAVRTDDKIGDLTRMAQAMHHEMEAVIRDHPGMYLWMHDRFKRVPDKGEQGETRESAEPSPGKSGD